MGKKRIKTTNYTTEPLAALPQGPVMDENPQADLYLYHWAPRERRKSIQKRGLVPGSNSVGHDWKPPYICFSDDALLAWTLSGHIHPEIKEWDLWMVSPHALDGWEVIFDTYPDTGRHFVKEYRVYHRIYKRDVEYTASRTQ